MYRGSLRYKAEKLEKKKHATMYLLADHIHTKRDEALERVIASCGKASPSIAYIGAASSDSKVLFSAMKRSLLDAGAGRVELARLVSRRASPGTFREIIEASDIIHMCSGDVEKGMSVLEERDMIQFLRAQMEKGKHFFGFSAGSIMLSRSWIRWTDPANSDIVTAFPCMGFARVYCDTHAEAEGFIELKMLLSLMPGKPTGYGIPQAAGLEVSRNGSVRAICKPVWRFRKRAGGIERIEDLEP
jgi:peptidase E